MHEQHQRRGLQYLHDQEAKDAGLGRRWLGILDKWGAVGEEQLVSREIEQRRWEKAEDSERRWEKESEGERRREEGRREEVREHALTRLPV